MNRHFLPVEVGRTESSWLMEDIREQECGNHITIGDEQLL